MDKTLAQTATDSTWLTVAEAARIARCSSKLLYSAHATGRLRAARIGVGRGALRIHRDWLDTYITACATPVEVTR